MNTLRRHRLILNLFMMVLMLMWQVAQPLQAAVISWTAGSNSNFNWSVSQNWSAGVPTASDDLLFPSPVPNPGGVGGNPQVIVLAGQNFANSLRFLSGYSLTGGSLAVGSGGIRSDWGMTSTISSLLDGNSGLVKTGGGAVRLTNNANTYTGLTSINNGALIISGQGALGSDTSPIVVSGSATRGFGGGHLVLEGGYTSGVNLTRDLSLQGLGPVSANGVALLSVQNNTISGQFSNGTGAVNTAMHSASGRLTLNNVALAGTTGTIFTTFGAGNGVGTGSYEINGVLSGTGSIQKTGGGTLLFSPSDASGYAGTLRVSGGSIRLTSGSVLGTNSGTGTSGMLDLNGDSVFFEVRSDNPAINKNIYQRAVSPSLFADHAIGSSMINGTASFASLAFEEGETFSFNGRNGFGMSFTTTPVQGGTGNTTFTNNLGGLLSFSGAFWSNTDNTGARIFTFGGNGNTLISGALTASAAAFDHSLVKSGSGLLTITSTGSTLDGSVTVSGGALAITDFRSITNNTGTIHLGSTGTTAGSLIIGTTAAANAAGLTTSKVINLNGTTAAATIYANQSGTNPVIFNSAFTATGGAVGDAKTLTLGGTNTANNIINGRIPNNAAGGTVNLAKNGPGTWVLAGDNTFSGTLTLTNGTLKIQDTYSGGASRNVIGSTAAVTFNVQSTTQEAGSLLEYVGATGSPSAESLGALTLTAGANTIKTTAGASGGTATLTFASLVAPNNSSSANFISSASSPIIVTGAAVGYNPGRLYFNGADYAYFDASGAVRAPVYGTDALFSSANTFIASNHAWITADSTTAAITQKSVKMDGNVTLNLTGNLTLNNGSNTAGNILATGGSSTISGSGSITGPGSSVLGVRVNGPSDILTINSNIIGGTGGLNKNGLGKLILNGTANTITGETRINEGEIEIGTGSRLGGNGTSTFTALTIRGTGILDVGGNSIGVAALNGSGVITNDNILGTTSTLTVGNADGTGTWAGVFKDGTGMLNVTKVGTGAQTWSGSNTYTGITTIGSTGLVTVNTLANIGEASGIGAGNASNDASNAASLVFNGSTGGLVYAGNLLNGALALGSASTSTDRLFTLAGTGATLSSTASNNNAVVFTNTGTIVHGIVGPQNLILTGTSTGDNRLNPKITDSGSGANVTSVTKTGTGLWILGNSANTYSGPTTVSNGVLALSSITGSLPNASNLVIDGGILQAGGTLNRTLGAGTGQFRFTAPAADTARFIGGFAGGNTKLSVAFGGNPVWGTTSNFIDGRNGLVLSSTAALSEVEITDNFSLGAASGAAKVVPAMVTTSGSATVNGLDTAGLIVGQLITGPGITAGSYIVSINSASQVTISANAGTGFGTGAGTVEASALRPIRVDDNSTTFTDFATITGSISGNAGTGIRKLGGGVLQLFGQNTYSGETNVAQGTLVVTSLGNSQIAGNSSIGTNTNANLPSNALTLGNSGSGAGVLQYVGPGETSDRLIRLNTTTGSTQIHADGSGPLILTNVLNDMTAGAKTLFLRGANTQGNMITSVLADNVGTLGLTIDGGATWILTGNNTLTGLVDITSGAVGAGHNNALGTGTVRIRNGSLFAYGGDRTLTNPLAINSTTSAGTSTFVGDNNLTLTGNWAYANTTAGHVLTNGITTGKTLNLAGNMAFDALTGNVSLTINGAGDTVIGGNITTSTALNLSLTYSGTGSLTLGGAASQWNAGAFTQSSGRVKLGANNVFANATTSNITINPGLGIDATFDLNGHSDTIRGLAAITAGNIFIDNSSASPASLTFGNGDQAVAFIGSVKNMGTGALSLIKTGSVAATFSQGPFQHKGATTVLGSSLTLAGDVTNTSSLSVTGTGSLLALTGGFSGSTGLTALTVGGGSTLSLLDGVGSLIPNLTSLSLGASGTGTATLNLNVGTGATDTITLLNGGNLALGNTITFNMNDAGLSPNTTYTLLSVPGGGLSAFGLSKFLQGSTPGGFSSLTWDVQDTYVRITTGTLITGNLYWRGLTNTTWNGNTNNWSTNEAGTLPASTIPGAGTDVIFQADGATGGVLTTTLEQNFKINSLAFEASSNALTSVTINAGTVAGNRMDISPQASSSGIRMDATGPSAVTINTAIKLGAVQTWSVANAAHTLTVNGSLLGDGNLTKTGAGKVILAAAADGTFGATTVTVSGGALEIGNVGALGSSISGNAATVHLETGGLFYYNNATAGTVTNNLVLNGGTLASGSAGGTASLTHTYSGAINLQGESTISTRDLGTNTATAGTRSITLSGPITGAGRMIVNGNTALSSGSSIAGTVILTQSNPLWSGGVLMQQGTLDLRQEGSLGTGAVTIERGRMLFKGAAGTTWSQFANGLTVDAASGNAVVELQSDNQGTGSQFTTDLSGTVTLGGSGATPILRFYQADLLSNIRVSGNVVLKTNATIHNSSAGSINLGVSNVISGVISENGGSFGLTVNGDTTWGSNNYQLLRLDAANTFTGPVTVGGGILDYSTVSNIGGPASNLGQGSIINLTGGNLRFIGGVSQTTNRNIFVNATSTLSASGTGGATMTFTAPIDTTGLPSGGTFTLAGTGEGFITGGILMSGAGGAGLGSADLTPTSGIWNFSGTPSSLTDDFINTGTVTINLNATGIITWGSSGTSTSPNFYLRAGAVANLNANDAISFPSTGSLLMGDQSGTGATNTLNMNGFNLTVPATLTLGATGDLFEGVITGPSSTLTVGTSISVSRGRIEAKLAGAGAIVKSGLGTVIFSGDNSGLTGTTAARVDAGTLLLDYTSSNTDKLRSGTGLDMRGGILTLNGNATAATTQSVASLTLANGGSNVININPGLGQTTTLNLGGITRAASAGTLRVNLASADGFVTTSTSNGTHGFLGGYATIKDSSGTWFATNQNGTGTGSIAGLMSVVKNDTSSWQAGDHVTDESSGYTGTVVGTSINSLRFNAGGGSSVNVAATSVLNIASGGILVTDQVIAGSPGILGGTLATGVTEFILTQDSSRLFTLSSDLRLNNALTKTGDGPLLLSGNNNYTSQTQVQGGIIQLAGGNAIGDTSLVTLADDRISGLQLLNSETIGRLQGGSVSSGMTALANVAVGTHTLTLNTTGGNVSYSGTFTGTGTIIKTGSSNQALSNSSEAFTGSLVINEGLIQINNIGRIDASSITINKSGNLLLDNNGTTRIGTRILDTTPIFLNSADGVFSGETIIRGLAFRTDQDSGTSNTENFGVLNFSSGASYASLQQNGTSNSRAILLASNFNRENGATFNIRARGLGSNATGTGTTGQAHLRISDATNETAFIASMIGGGGALGTTTQSIVPWAIAENTTAAIAATNMGNSLATYVTGRGFIALDLATEYATYSAATATANTRESLAGDLTGLSGKTLNSLVLHNNSTTASTTYNVTGSGSGQTLAVTSGAFLFTLNSGAAAGAYGINLGGFNGGITVGGSNEYVFHVVNPSNATASVLTATISSPLISTADITKSGRGVLVLTGTNTAGGGSRKTTLNEGLLEVSDLDNIGGNTGALVFAGGTLRFSSTYTGDDLSSRTITFLSGGGTIDTNGQNLALAGSLGSGVGGFTKAGAGTLTLNAAATYTGATTVSNGTLALGANNAIGSGNLSIGGTATLALGTRSVNVGSVITSGTTPAITGTGTITASGGYLFNHTGDTAIAAVLAGSQGLTKAQANVLTLTGLNTYSGITEVQAGTLSFDSIANVGVASALGRPTSAQNGLIRMGLTTANTGLNYTGAGHSSDRLLVLQGTTGGVTLNANGTGALNLAGAQVFTAGAKTLTVGGTSDPLIENRLGAIQENNLGVLTVTKADANTWLFTAPSVYSGSTNINNGTLRLGVANALPNTTSVRLGNSSTAGVFDLNGFDQTIAGFSVTNNSTTATSRLLIASGKTLTVNGNVTLGVNADNSTTLFTAAGGGNLVVNSSGGTFQVGGATGGTNENNVTADLSGLANVSVDLGATGTFRVGDLNTGTTAAVSILTLATNNTLIAGSIRVGDSAGPSNPSTLVLGSGTNSFNADLINIGSAGSGIRSGGNLRFGAADTTGTLTIRGSAGGTTPTVLNLVNTSGSTGGNIDTIVDLAGHTADILVSTLTMATRSNNTGGTTSTLSFDQGKLEVATFNMANRTGTGTGGATAIVNLGDSVAAGTPTTSIGVLNMAVNTSAGGTVSADFNVTGGTVTIGTGSGTAINMANAISGRTVTSTLDLTGGSVTVTGNIVRTLGGGTENATITLAGSILDMSGHSIGGSGAPIALVAASGVLKNLGQFNGGADLVKTTTGRLVLEGLNTYTGNTLVNGGTLLVNNLSGSGTGSGNVTLTTGTLLGGFGTISGTVSGVGIISPGDMDVGGNSLIGKLTVGTLSLSTASSLLLQLGGYTAADSAGVLAYMANSSGFSVPASWTDYQSGSQHDQLALTGNAPTFASTAINVTNTNGFSPTFGQIFQLLDWSTIGSTSVSGSYTLNLPTLTNGFNWNTDLFASHGIVMIVPEPGRLMLLMLGWMWMLLRRRRRSW